MCVIFKHTVQQALQQCYKHPPTKGVNYVFENYPIFQKNKNENNFKVHTWVASGGKTKSKLKLWVD